MPDSTNTRRIPAPQARAFVACRKITNDPQTVEIVIVGPASRWRTVLSGRDPVLLWKRRAGEREREQG